MGAGGEAISSTVEFASDPNVAAAGTALASVGGVATAASGPVGLAVGAVLTITGGLMNFSGAEEEVNKNDLIWKGIEEMNLKLDLMLDNQEVMKSMLEDLLAGQQMIIDEIGIQASRKSFGDILNNYDFTGDGLATLQDIFYEIMDILKKEDL